MEVKLEGYIDSLMARYPQLEGIRQKLRQAYLLLEQCYESGGKLLAAGNGGSAADSGHIVGELMKSFRLPRRVHKDLADRLQKIDPVRGALLAKQLEYGLPAIPLTAQDALTTAYLNDVGMEGMFAQQLLGYGKPGDVFLGISTSGNSENVINAAIVAKALRIPVIGLTGASGGILADYAEVTIQVPEREAYLVQELHLPVYHCLCLMLEERFFGSLEAKG